MNDYISERMRTNGTNRTVEPNIYATKTGQLRVQLNGKWLPKLSETLGGARIKLYEAKKEIARLKMSKEIDRLTKTVAKAEALYFENSASHNAEMQEATDGLAAAHRLNRTTGKT